MHDYLLSMVGDYIDESIKNDIDEFYVKTFNRYTAKNKPFPVVKTLLNDGDIIALEKTEHEFSVSKIEVSYTKNEDDVFRLPSAKRFKIYPALEKKLFEKIIVDSFGSSEIDNTIVFPYPSGGALYSGQVVVYIKNVAGYDAGAYHYLQISNQLEKLNNLDNDLINESLFINKESSLINYDFFILYGSLLDKHICKYGYRGFRLAMLEIGSMYKNLEFFAQKESLKNRVWGGFNDEALTVSLGLDPRAFVPVICQIVGRE